MTQLDVPVEVSHVRIFLDRLSLVVKDSLDEDDIPDWLGVNGTVSVSPKLSEGSVVLTSSGRGFIPVEKTFNLVDGSFSAKILNPSDPDLNPKNWSYKVTITITEPTRIVLSGTLTPGENDVDINLLPLLPLSSITGGLVTIPAVGYHEHDDRYYTENEIDQMFSVIELTPGDDGLSAYQIAVVNGFSGTETEWLASLHGAAGPTAVSTDAGNTATLGSDSLIFVPATEGGNGITTVSAGTNLSTARPAGVGVVYWIFDNGVDVGEYGANVVNGLPGDFYFVAGA